MAAGEPRFAPSGTSTTGLRCQRAPRWSRGYDDAVSPAIRLERSGPGDAIARVTLARPEVHNAFDASTVAELRTTFAALDREDPARPRAVNLDGDGPSFCSA